MKVGNNVHDLPGIEQHYKDVLELKCFFMNNSGVFKYTAYKVWASWVISHMALIEHPDSFLPTIDIELDTQIIKNLSEKGVSHNNATKFYALFLERCKQFHPKPGPGLNTNKAEVKYISSENAYVISYGSITHQISTNLYTKLNALYMNGKTEHNFFNNLLIILNHYQLLDGLSYQWSIPLKVFNVLQEHLHLKGELFASPLNSLSNNFWSLFEIDRLFSSNGNFFKSSYEQLVNPQELNVYQANPPFIEKIFIHSANLISQYLKKAKENNHRLMFIYFMPDWLDSFGYNLLLNSPFFLNELVIQKEAHCYYEMTKKKSIRVQFDTHILVLGSMTSLAQLWTESVQDKIRHYFCPTNQ